MRIHVNRLATYAFFLATILSAVPLASLSKCLSTNEQSRCRYPAGDDWCGQNGGGNRYAYSNKCLRDSEPAQIQNGNQSVSHDDTSCLDFYEPKASKEDPFSYSHIQNCRHPADDAWCKETTGSSHPYAYSLECMDENEKCVQQRWDAYKEATGVEVNFGSVQAGTWRLACETGKTRSLDSRKNDEIGSSDALLHLQRDACNFFFESDSLRMEWDKTFSD